MGSLRKSVRELGRSKNYSDKRTEKTLCFSLSSTNTVNINTMSWQQYVDDQLLATKQVKEAVILGHDGNVWATSHDFSVTPEELKRIVADYNSVDTLAQSGVTLAGTRYMYISREGKEGNQWATPGQDCPIHHHRLLRRARDSRAMCRGHGETRGLPCLSGILKDLPILPCSITVSTFGSKLSGHHLLPWNIIICSF